MPARSRHTLEQLLEAVRGYVRDNLPGCAPSELTIRLTDGRKVQHPVPAVCAADPSPRPRASPDFASLDWFGRVYSFTPAQRPVVRVLLEAWEDGAPEVGQAALLEAAGSDGGRLRDLFRGSEAWGELIVPGAAKGTFRLADPG